MDEQLTFEFEQRPTIKGFHRGNTSGGLSDENRDNPGTSLSEMLE